MTEASPIPPPIRPRRLLAAASLLAASLAALTGCVGVAAPVQPTGYSATCYAGTYVCQLGGPVPAGSQCTCPGIGAPSFGVVR